jgi:hypothetical protein
MMAVNDNKKQLLETFSVLDDQNKQLLLDFAELLRSRSNIEPVDLPEPLSIPRPEQESVVAAIKRLSETYNMLDKKNILTEASGLMAQHIMQGREASEVIDELETIFSRNYEKVKNEIQGN